MTARGNTQFLLTVTEKSHKRADRILQGQRAAPSTDNISKLAVIHNDEIISVSEENNPYYTTGNEHQWLDKNGWLHRKANVINSRNGNIYNLTVDIAKAKDGRTILYATNGKIKKVGNVQVGSLKIKGPGQNSNTDIIPQTPEKVNRKNSISETFSDDFPIRSDLGSDIYGKDVALEFPIRKDIPKNNVDAEAKTEADG